MQRQTSLKRQPRQSEAGQSPTSLGPQLFVPMSPPPRTDVDATTEDQELLRKRDNFDEVASIARSAYKIGKEILGELNVEHKKIQNQWYSIPSYNNGGIAQATVINQCIQGITDGTRTGDSIKVTGLRISCLMDTLPEWDNKCHVRFMVVWQPGPGVLYNVFPTSASTIDGFMDYDVKSTRNAVNAAKDYDSATQFEVIWDKTFYLDEILGPRSHAFKHHIEFSRKTYFENNSSVINNGVLSLLCFSDTTYNTTGPICYLCTDVYFVDN